MTAHKNSWTPDVVAAFFWAAVLQKEVDLKQFDVGSERYKEHGAALLNWHELWKAVRSGNPEIYIEPWMLDLVAGFVADACTPDDPAEINAGKQVLAWVEYQRGRWRGTRMPGTESTAPQEWVWLNPR